jgi:hypothetical protein
LNNLAKIRGSGLLFIFSLGFPSLGFVMYIKVNTYVECHVKSIFWG